MFCSLNSLFLLPTIRVIRLSDYLNAYEMPLLHIGAK